jgi:hypothetical protein
MKCRGFWKHLVERDVLEETAWLGRKNLGRTCMPAGIRSLHSKQCRYSIIKICISSNENSGWKCSLGSKVATRDSLSYFTFASLSKRRYEHEYCVHRAIRRGSMLKRPGCWLGQQAPINWENEVLPTSGLCNNICNKAKLYIFVINRDVLGTPVLKLIFKPHGIGVVSGVGDMLQVPARMLHI